MADPIMQTVVEQSRFIKALDGTEKKLRKKLMRKALTVGARIIKRQMKTLLAGNVRTGLLRKAIHVSIRSYEDGRVMVAIIGPRKDTVGEYKGRRIVPWRYAHLVDLGTKSHSIGARSQHPGARAVPFIEPAREQTKSQVQSEMAKIISQGLRPG